jgi:AraC family transcriptional regulator, carnitine catabolism transcriptional activator
MQSSQKSSAATQQIGVLLFEHFSNHCLANAVEPLRAANMLSRKHLYQWHFVTVDGGPVASSSGLPVLPEARLSDHPGGDMLLVLPSYGHLRHATPATERALRAAARRFSLVAGLDTGSWLLAAAGLLDGYRATIHWDEFDAFSETFPQVTTDSARFVIDRNRASCGGAMTAFDLVQDLIGRMHGPALQLEIASLFMQGAPMPRKATARTNLVDAAVLMMRQNLEEPLTVPALARRLGCTQRKLETRFQQRLSDSPRKIYQRLRLQAARRMIAETGGSVAEIALRCGYGDASAMTRAYRLEFGCAPTATRAAHQLGRAVPITGANNSSSK